MLDPVDVGNGTGDEDAVNGMVPSVRSALWPSPKRASPRVRRLLLRNGTFAGRDLVTTNCPKDRDPGCFRDGFAPTRDRIFSLANRIRTDLAGASAVLPVRQGTTGGVSSAVA